MNIQGIFFQDLEIRIGCSSIGIVDLYAESTITENQKKKVLNVYAKRFLDLHPMVTFL